MNYDSYKDEELINLYREGDRDIAEYLLKKYKNLVLKKATSMYILGADKDDLIQEGTIGLFKAICDYDFGRDASFFTFAELCISRQIYTAVQSSGRKKHGPLNSYVSLYLEKGEDEGAELIEGLENPKERNPEELYLDQERVSSIETMIQEELSDFERQVLELSMTGIGYMEIAKILCKDPKATDNALQRGKTKMRKALKREQDTM